MPEGHSAPTPHPRLPLRPQGFDVMVFWVLTCGFCLLYIPAYADLAGTIWASDEQGHGPIILAVSAWLLYGKRHELAAAPQQPVLWLGWPTLVLALVLYSLGRSQDIIMFEIGAQII